MSSRFTTKRFRQAATAFMVGRAVQALGSLLLAVVLVRLLEPKEYGAYMTIWGLASLVGPISSMGLGAALRRFLPELAEGATRRVIGNFLLLISFLRCSLLVIVLLGLMLFWDSIALALNFDSMLVEQAIMGLLMVGVFIALGFLTSALEGMLEQRWSQSILALFALGRLVGIGVLAWFSEASIANVIWIDVFVGTLCLIITLIVLVHKVSSLSVIGDRQVAIGQVLEFSWHMAGVGVIQSMTGVGIQRLLIARLLGLEDAGLFAFLQQFTKLIGRYMPSRLIANLVRPMLISRTVAGKHGVVQDALSSMWKGNTMMLLSLIVPLVVVGDWIFGVLSGSRFNEAGLLVVILLIGQAAVSQQHIIIMSMQINSRTSELRFHSLLLFLVPVLGVAGYQYGLAGFLAGFSIAKWIRNLVGYRWMQQAGLSFSFDMSAIFRLVIALVLLFAVSFLVDTIFGHLVSLVVVSMGTLLCLVIARPLNEQDFSLFKRALGSSSSYLIPLVNK